MLCLLNMRSARDVRLALPVQALQEASLSRVADCRCTLVLQRAMGAGITCRCVLVLSLGILTGDSNPSPIIRKSHIPEAFTGIEVFLCWCRQSPSSMLGES